MTNDNFRETLVYKKFSSAFKRGGYLIYYFRLPSIFEDPENLLKGIEIGLKVLGK